MKNNMEKMDSNQKIPEMKDRKVILSTLWIFATLNYLYADTFTLFFDPTAQEETMRMTEGFVLGFAVLMETAIAMVLLSRVLKYRANRLANIIAGIIHTAAVFLSMFVGTPALYYIFFATIEISCTLFIVWYAWKWSNYEGNSKLLT
jgi:hypothetical protein